ncbi:hypothetical protein HFN60_32965 [Rhizobium leguminosarum]|uniref:helix-turn-helix domain-containing protein n=1 Tax=Rhizobium leguminosarum TaxID=384 RepID=UPI001C989D2E|nr:helix-turn-helix domain-containing protein [Rhizobium leguminosarum]MBY5820402.1 hypothetical protein [Rhizobium leguminosarum]
MPFEIETSNEEIRQRGYLKARDEAFNAVYKLWCKRIEEGVSQKDIAEFLGRDAAWVSRALRGPANWTMRTFGELVEALDGVIEIGIVPVEDLPLDNYDIYEELHGSVQKLTPISSESSIQGANYMITVSVPSNPSVPAFSVLEPV